MPPTFSRISSSLLCSLRDSLLRWPWENKDKISTPHGTVLVASIAGTLDEARALNLLFKFQSIDLEDQGPVALLLRVSSNGGSLGAAQAVAEGLEQLRVEFNIPTVSLVTDVAASAAFYAALAADKVVAAPAATLGNTGSIIRKISPVGALNALGLRYDTVSSGPFKDALGDIATLDEMQAAMLQTVVEDQAAQFLEHVKSCRGVGSDTISHIRNGEIFSGRRALQLGLVDEVGGLFAAQKLCAKLLNVDAVVPTLVDETAKPQTDAGLLSSLLHHWVSR